jgi:hypothetical protein
MEFAGRIARGDDGLQIPFTISTVAEKEAGRGRLVAAATLAETLGYDVEGVARLSESFVDGTLEVIGEVDATMVVLGWDGPRVGSDYLFGSEVDAVGRQSTVPVIAAHLIRPWDRVIVVPGSAEVRWQSYDARIALKVATRIRATGDAPVVVIGPHQELVQEEVDARDKLEFISSAIPGDDLLEIIRDDDIVVAPAYLLPDLPLARRLRLANRLAESNVAIVGGPGKLSVAPAYLTHAMESILGPKL